MAINELKDGIDALVDETTKEPDQTKKEPNPKTLRIKNASDPNAKKVKLGQAEPRESQFAKKFPDRFGKLVEMDKTSKIGVLPKTADDLDDVARTLGVDIPKPQVKTQKTPTAPKQATPDNPTPENWQIDEAINDYYQQGAGPNTTAQEYANFLSKYVKTTPDKILERIVAHNPQKFNASSKMDDIVSDWDKANNQNPTPNDNGKKEPNDLPDEIDVLFQDAESKDPGAIKDLMNYIDDLDYEYKLGNYTPNEYKDKLLYAKKLLDNSTFGLKYFDEIGEQIDGYLDDLENEPSTTIQRDSHNISLEDFNQFSSIISKYMPDSGEGDTQASQAVTALNKLIYKWFNDGDTYSNTNPKLRGWANDLSSYANWLAKYVPQAQQILDEYENLDNAQDYTNLLFDLTDVVLNPNTLASLSSKKKEGSIYDERGNYEWINDDELGKSKYSDFIDDLNNPYGQIGFDRSMDDFIDKNVDKNQEISPDELGKLWTSYLYKMFRNYDYDPYEAEKWFYKSFETEALLSDQYEEFKQKIIDKTGNQDLINY